ncbi:MAG: threonine synthase [Candidatus Marinimicrobia bacterium]|nr:threonine synthase [Candidatus Neomarinimicrobiota bacterium]
MPKNMTIPYHSTDRALSLGDPVPFGDALFTGLAPDGGLFMPDQIPALSGEELLSLVGKPYAEVACSLLHKYLSTEIDGDDLERIVIDAYDFEIPIEQLDERTYLMRLDRGPTASFKDFGARFMARMMAHLRPGDREITVLVATSGDTGSAVGEAYRGLDGFRVFILYPREEVSTIQKQQLDSIGKNVQAVAVDGKFDDCQQLVKAAFTDSDLTNLNLTSANSINIGRLLPQIVYYVYAYVNTSNYPETVAFSVPSGNFGNSLGCELARRMGLPVGRIIIAVNENDEFPRFLQTGVYEKVDPSRACLSNAMNVGNPSNLARYFDLYGGILTKDGTVTRAPDISGMLECFFSTSVSDDATVALIKEVYAEHGVLVEPHGAVGLEALKRFRQQGNSATAICLETAHPGKFPSILEEALDIEIAPPESFRKFADRRSHADHLDNDYASFKDYLIGNS